jgi:hypothetical protein
MKDSGAVLKKSSRTAQCEEIQSCYEAVPGRCAGDALPQNVPAKTTFHLFEKSWHLRISGFVATLPAAGPFPAR